MNADWRGFACFLLLFRARFRESFKRIGHQHRGVNYSRNEYGVLFLFLSKTVTTEKGREGKEPDRCIEPAKEGMELTG